MERLHLIISVGEFSGQFSTMNRKSIKETSQKKISKETLYLNCTFDEMFQTST